MKKFLDTYQQLNRDSLFLLREIYAENVHFIDPVHQINGLDNLTAYFAVLYENIISIEFLFDQPVTTGNKGAVQWQMIFRHKRLAGGKQLSLHGASFIEFNQRKKVCEHHDYFDLGTMVYEHIPLVGNLIRTVKKRIGT